MIQDNASNIFAGKVLGIDKNEQQFNQNQFQAEQYALNMQQDAMLRATQPINFNEKIMGGENAARFLHGKLPELGGSYNYTQKVNMLTGKGAMKMEEENNTIEKTNMFISNSGNATNKINMILGGGNNTQKSFDKIGSMLGGNSNGKSNLNVFDKIGSMLGGNSNGKSKGNSVDKFSSMLGGNSKDNATNKLNMMLGKNTSGKQVSKTNINQFFNTSSKNNNGFDIINKVLNPSSKKNSNPFNNNISQFFVAPNKKSNVNFDSLTGLGKRAFAGINIHDKISSSFGMNGTGIRNTLSNNKNAALNKINEAFRPLNNTFGNDKMFNMLGNPEKIAKNRMQQQQGLPMFGDFDGDKVLNMFDCNPLDKNKQGEIHTTLDQFQNENTEYLPAVTEQSSQDPNFVMLSEERSPEVIPDYTSNEPNFTMEGADTVLPATQDSNNVFNLDDDTDYISNNNVDNSDNIFNSKKFKVTDGDTKEFLNVEKDGTITGTTIIRDDENNSKSNRNTSRTSRFGNVNGNETILEQPVFKETKINSKSNQSISGLNSRIRNAESLLQNTTDLQERKSVLSLLKGLYKSKETEDKLNFDKEKYEQGIKNTTEEKLQKSTLGMATLGLQEMKYGGELGLTREKLAADKEANKFKQDLTQQQFDYQKSRDAQLDKATAKKQQQLIELEKDKLRFAAGKNDRALWESKLRSGENMLGSLIGGANKPTDFGAKVGPVGGSVSSYDNLLSGVKGNLQHMNLMAGGAQYQQPFGNKVYESVGMPTQQKSFTQKVKESVTNKPIEDVLMEERAMREQEYSQEQIAQQPQMSQPQIVQQPIPRQQIVQQPVYTQPVYGQPPQQTQAEYDLEYEKYKAETAGEFGYRRGPYKKRRY